VIVLVVEDNEVVATTYAHVLTAEGYQVRVAGSVVTGLEMALTSRPNAVLLDLRMDNARRRHRLCEDGIGFLRQFRAHDEQRATPVAIVTGDYFLNEFEEHQIEQFGATLCFKPLWAEELVALVGRLLHADTRGAHNRTV
jgi:DNA-binding response OmpR family regulator